jgi:hypothetical protein
LASKASSRSLDRSRRAITIRINSRASAAWCDAEGAGRSSIHFEVLLAYARNERTWRHWQGECIRKRAELGALQAEERRTKARLKHASRKDAAAAVAEERARGERERMQMADAARDIVTRAKRIDRLARSRP